MIQPVRVGAAEANGQPKIEFVILAQRVEILNGKLYLMGGGFDSVLLDGPPPQVVPLTFVVDLVVPPQASGQRHHLQFAVLDEAGVALECVTEKVEDSPLGKLVMSLRAFAAEVEREKIVERTTRGKLERAKSGRIPQAFGRGCYGYVSDPTTGQREIEPYQAEVVRRLVQPRGVPNPAGAVHHPPAELPVAVDHHRHLARRPGQVKPQSTGLDMLNAALAGSDSFASFDPSNPASMNPSGNTTSASTSSTRMACQMSDPYSLNTRYSASTFAQPHQGCQCTAPSRFRRTSISPMEKSSASSYSRCAS